MPDQPRRGSEEAFTDEVGRKEARKLRARRRGPGVLRFFGAFGVVGWSVVLPTLAGAALGRWMDRREPGRLSWTLTWMVAGLLGGAWNAWRWIERERKELEKEEGNTNHE